MPSKKIRTAASCADDREPGVLSVAEARKHIQALLAVPQGMERLALRDALGRVLGEDLISPMNVPAHTNSAMDGYALAGRDLPGDELKDYRMAGTAYAGAPYQGGCGNGECVRIMTGSPMPPGTDTVVMQEHTELQADGRVRIGSGHRTGQNVRQAGEDIARGSRVLTAGRLLGPADLGILASLGRGEVSVRRRLRVAFFSTGDELRGVGEPLGDGDVYDSNRYSLYGMLKRPNVDLLDLGVVGDQPDSLRDAFRAAAAMADVVITSGGVSVGEADHTKPVLQQLGEMNFWKIAMKPGRPLTFGRLGDAVFFGLPGNPVAVMVTFYQFVQPALYYLASGEIYQPLTVDARCENAIRKRPGRFEFIRGILNRSLDGTLRVASTGQQGSGILTSMSIGNCFILLPETCSGVAQGEMVEVQPFSGMT